MGTRGLIVYKWKGLYYITYNHWDSYPEALGVTLASNVPSDPQEFEAWKSKLITKFERIAAECLLNNSAHERYGYETSPTSTPAYNDLFIEWVYTHDLDRDVFIVSSANDDDHRVYFDLRMIPGRLFSEIDRDIVNIERPGFEPMHDEEVYNISERDQGCLAMWVYEEPKLEERFVNALKGINKVLVGDVRDMFAGTVAKVPPARFNIGIWLQQCFLKQYNDAFRYQRNRYTMSSYVSRQLALITLRLFLYSAGVGNIQSRVIENDPKANMMIFREIHPRWEAPDEVFWLTDRVLIIMVQDLKDDEVTMVNAIGQAILAVQTDTLPTASGEVEKAESLHIIVVSNALDNVMFVSIDQPSNGDNSNPTVKHTKPLPLVSINSGCIDETTEEINAGIPAIISFLSLVHSQECTKGATSRLQQSKSSFLTLPVEVTQNILCYTDCKTFRAMSQTCASVREICNLPSNVRMGDITICSAHLSIIASTATRVSGEIIPNDAELEISATVQHSSHLCKNYHVVFPIAYPYEGEEISDLDTSGQRPRPVKRPGLTYGDERKKEYFSGIIELGIAAMEGSRTIRISGLELKAAVVCEYENKVEQR